MAEAIANEDVRIGLLMPADDSADRRRSRRHNVCIDYIGREYFWLTLISSRSDVFLLGYFEKLLDGGMGQNIIADAVGKHDDPVSGRGDLQVMGDHD